MRSTREIQCWTGRVSVGEKEGEKEREEGIFLRARNSRQHSVAKNASIADYKTATGFEALIGFLYLTGQNERLEYLLKSGEPSDGLS